MLYAAPDVYIDALPVGSDDVIERQASELFLCVAERLLKRGVRLHDALGFDFYEEDVLRSLLDDRTVEQLALLDPLLSPLALCYVASNR